MNLKDVGNLVTILVLASLVLTALGGTVKY
jgi:hypothetical protein